ncbi:superfamily II DNA/RNA helicase [Propionibacteriaceae bacterium ES.041]|nr:superfamily II DNA/RNA helicase [Propionibacteriaceae bacterium ES.041]
MPGAEHLRVLTGPGPRRGITLSTDNLQTEAALEDVVAADLITDDERVADPQTTFADLGVLPEITQALDAVGITHPFPIQTMSIPIALAGTDMIGQARTGTGKTLAFGVSLLQRITVDNESGVAPQALVVAPTRELALQVSKDLEVASKIRRARVLTVYGGVGYEPQLDALAAGVDVVVGTPGRLLDLVNRRALDLRHIKVLVLDEADEMLDLGFLPDVERILSHTPDSRQTLLFSATMPSAIASLARTHLTQPVNIRAEHHDESQTVPLTTQFVYQAHDLDKPEIIGRVLQADEVEKVIVFCRTKRAAQRIADDLVDRGFNAAPIHGDLRQEAREKALKKFREGKVRVLVATDVAARGIDVSGVSHVINHESPDDDKTYVHRIGRTGRAGATGVAITLVDWADLTRWKVINKTLGLDFDEPVETYSTSAHLYTDLGIAEGTRGRIKDAEPAPRKERSREEGTERPREQRPKRNRNRRRTRNGEVLAEGEQQAEAAEPAGESQSEAQGDGEQKPRRRRRRSRGRGRGEGGGQATAESPAESPASED